MERVSVDTAIPFASVYVSSVESAPLFVEKSMRIPCRFCTTPFWSTTCAVTLTAEPAGAFVLEAGCTLMK
jgi:hypothetical protein